MSIQGHVVLVAVLMRIDGVHRLELRLHQRRPARLRSQPRRRPQWRPRWRPLLWLRQFHQQFQQWRRCRQRRRQAGRRRPPRHRTPTRTPSSTQCPPASAGRDRRPWLSRPARMASGPARQASTTRRRASLRGFLGPSRPQALLRCMPLVLCPGSREPLRLPPAPRGCLALVLASSPLGPLGAAECRCEQMLTLCSPYFSARSVLS